MQMKARMVLIRKKRLFHLAAEKAKAEEAKKTPTKPTKSKNQSGNPGGGGGGRLPDAVDERIFGGLVMGMPVDLALRVRDST
jgi:hypothetical protein